MTDQPDETTTTDDPQDGTEPAAEASPTDDTPDVSDAAQDAPGAAGEAARYRRRLREAEQQRDGLSERLQRLQRRDVERLAGERLSVAADLFEIGRVELAELLDDDGDVAPAKVAAALDQLLTDRPGLAQPGPVRWPDSGQGTRQQSTMGAQTKWAEVLHPWDPDAASR